MWVSATLPESLLYCTGRFGPVGLEYASSHVKHTGFGLKYVGKYFR